MQIASVELIIALVVSIIVTFASYARVASSIDLFDGHVDVRIVHVSIWVGVGVARVILFE